MNNLKIAMIGAGTMGSALTLSFVQAGIVQPNNVRIFDVNTVASETLASKIGSLTSIAATASDAADQCDIVILAVKPQYVAKCAADIASVVGTETVVVSIAAGITLATLEDSAPGRSVVRVMPNTPSLVSAGVAALCRGKKTTDGQFETVKSLFSTVGETVSVTESDMDAVTALSGSGPAYVFLFMESLSLAGVKLGLSRETARTLAMHTVYGSAKMAIASDDHLAQLRDNVTSPGGTTIAGIASLERGSFRSVVMEAVEAAAKRSRELSSL